MENNALTDRATAEKEPWTLAGFAAKLRRKKAAGQPPALPQLVVEPFDGQDYHTLSVLLNGYKAAVGQPLPTHAQWANLRLAIEQGQITCYIAWLRGKPVGICTVGLRYSSRQYAIVGLLSDMYVRPEARGQGVARALADTAVQTVLDAGGAGLRVSCQDEHAAFCRALGFDTQLGTTLCRVL